MIDPWNEPHTFGTGQAPFATVRITDPREPARLLANPALRVGEAYMDGTLVIEEGTLRDFLVIGVAAADDLARDTQPLSALAAPFRAFRQLNPIHRSRANVAHHYDLSEELYRLFLDQDLQ